MIEEKTSIFFKLNLHIGIFFPFMVMLMFKISNISPYKINASSKHSGEKNNIKNLILDVAENQEIFPKNLVN